MTLFVERVVVAVLDLAVLFRRDAGLDPFFEQGFAEPVAVIASIAGQGFGFWQDRKHEPCPFVIAHLPFAQEQDQRLACAIGDCMKLRVQAAFRAANKAGNSPF